VRRLPPRVEVVVNRNAGRLRAEGPLLRAIHDGAARIGAVVHETRSLDELAEVARAMAGRGVDTVVLAGGDGSTMAGVTALVGACGDAMPAVALAPGGSVGTVARNFGVHGGSAAWVQRVLRAAAGGPAGRDAPGGNAGVARTATIRVRDDAGNERVGFIFGAGLVANFFGAYEESERPGLATAANILGRVFAGSIATRLGARRGALAGLAREVLDPTPCTLVVDGAPVPGRAWSLVVASVVRDLGLHMRPTYRAGETLDRFHLVASGLPPAELGPQMLRVLAGRPLRGEPRVDALVRAFSLDFGEETNAYVLDGDVLRARRLEMETGPVLRVVRV
jgi:diacylglycerol kinase (ATP)